MESKQAQDEDKIRTEILKKWTSRMSHKQGRHHEFSTGGQILTGGGGTDSGESKSPTPKFQFLLGFWPLYFENIGRSENFHKYA